MRVNAIFRQLLLSKETGVSILTASFLLSALPLSLNAVAQQTTPPTSSPSTSPAGIQPLNNTPAPAPSSAPGAGSTQPNPLPPANNTPALGPSPATGASIPVGETDYTLGAGDLLRIDIFQVKDYSGQYPVLVDGTVSLPLIGRIQAEGQTLKDLSDQIAQKYSTYLRRPIITVGLVTARPLKIAISGEITTPGSYTVTFNEETKKFPSVTDSIERAGGLTTAANIRQVQIRRYIGGREQVINANLWDLIDKGAQSQNVTLRDGDSIYIPTVDTIDPLETFRLANASFGIRANRPVNVAVVGEVYRPGTYAVKPQEVTEQQPPQDPNNRQQQQRRVAIPPRLTQAIGSAGGIKPLANISEIQIRRLTRDGKQKTIAVNLFDLLQTGNFTEDAIVQEGDTIMIPKADKLDIAKSDQLASASFAPNSIKVNIVGEVIRPGAVDIPPNTPLNQALLAAGGFDNRRANRETVKLVRLNPDGTVNEREIKIDFSKNIDEETNPPMRNNDVVVIGRSGFTGFTDVLGALFNPVGSGVNLIRSVVGY
ncbi:MAG: polysaccharide biosynthesis/export family protein [Xenococcaceae cyanobacterium]